MNEPIDTDAVRQQVAASIWTESNPLEVAIRATPVPSDTIRALCDEVDRLRAALRKYGHHGPMCDGLPRGWGGAPLGPCDCGLDAALAPASDQLPVPERTTAEPEVEP